MKPFFILTLIEISAKLFQIENFNFFRFCFLVSVQNESADVIPSNVTTVTTSTTERARNETRIPQIFLNNATNSTNPTNFQVKE